jgi:hypothetical protein
LLHRLAIGFIAGTKFLLKLLDLLLLGGERIAQRSSAVIAGAAAVDFLRVVVLDVACAGLSVGIASDAAISSAASF